jgi:hypothetical protein
MQPDLADDLDFGDPRSKEHPSLSLMPLVYWETRESSERLYFPLPLLDELYKLGLVS